MQPCIPDAKEIREIFLRLARELGLEPDAHCRIDGLQAGEV